MTFEQAVKATPSIAGAFCPGLRALGGDSARVKCRLPKRATGSIDLDTHLKPSRPSEPRWDYGIGVKNGIGEVAVWVEVHPASSSHVDEMLRKLLWLRGWLAAVAPALDAMSVRFVWIASGAVSLRPGTPQRLRVAKEGLEFAGERFEIR